MKKIFTLLLALLLIFTFVGCKNETNTDRPTAALYTSRGGIEIYEVETDSNFGSDAVKYVKIYARFLNTADEELYMTVDSLLMYYDADGVALPYMDDEIYEAIDPTELGPGYSVEGWVYFKIPIDVEVVRLECTTEGGIGIFLYSI
jgi:hypothetical protein